MSTLWVMSNPRCPRLKRKWVAWLGPARTALTSLRHHASFDKYLRPPTDPRLGVRHAPCPSPPQCSGSLRPTWYLRGCPEALCKPRCSAGMLRPIFFFLGHQLHALRVMHTCRALKPVSSARVHPIVPAHRVNAKKTLKCNARHFCAGKPLVRCWHKAVVFDNNHG